MRDDIMERGADVLATFGRHRLTTASLAFALNIGVGTLRRYFADIDVLLNEILENHLRHIAASLAEIPADAPHYVHRLCAAYVDHTREPDGRFTQAHTLLMLDRSSLPEDLRDSLERQREAIAATVGGIASLHVLDLLDMPTMTVAKIPAMLAYVVATLKPRQPAPLAITPLSESARVAPEFAAMAEQHDHTHLRPPPNHQEQGASTIK